MATKKRDIPEAEAERQISDSLERLDELRIDELKQISEEQRWKMEVLRAEEERLEPTLTKDHPRLVRMRAQMEHYSISHEGIQILIDGATDDNEQPGPTGSWELSGIVRYRNGESSAGLKVVLEPAENNLKTLEAECNTDGYYQIRIEPAAMRRYMGVGLLLKVYDRRGKVIYTTEKPIVIKEGKETQDINI
ncbi:MAG: hypothetical protein JWQ28_2951 [Pedobacter sp.]|jgi:hypothetical protein|nr:hypothetical protein [Pedobacter sp.]